MIHAQLFVEQLESQTSCYDLHVLSISCPKLDGLAWLNAQNGPEKFFWSTRDQSVISAGVGVSYTQAISATQPDLFDTIGQEIHPDATGYVQLPFSNHDQEGWEAYNEAKVIFPKLEYEETRQGARWKVYCNKAQLENAEAYLNELLGDCRWDIKEIQSSPLKITKHQVSPSQDEWCNTINTVQDTFAKSSCDKVVLARQLDLNCESQPDAFAMLNTLRDEQGTSYFGLVQYRQNDSFIFKSPERLVSIQDNTLETEALAGSIQRGQEPGADSLQENTLLRSSKNRWEHSLVIDHIETVLKHYCRSVQVAKQRSILKLPYIQHILQPVRAHIDSPKQWAALIDQLHPTPAVCGYDRKTAMALIQKHEPFNRGLYAGAFGVLTHKALELAVTIRAARIQDKTVRIFTGAGVVADSDALEEWQELNQKSGAFSPCFQNLNEIISCLSLTSV